MNESAVMETRRNLLYDSHKELGAEFKEAFNWEMPAFYSDAATESRDVRTGVGVIDLSYSGAIRVRGSEAAAFLHNLVTNDVKALKNGEGFRAAFLTGHGKIRAFCRILRLNDHYLVITDPQTHEKVYKYIFPFSYAGDFKVEDASDDYRIISIQGPKSLLVLKEVCFEPVPELQESSFVSSLIAGQNVLVVRASHSTEGGYDILVPSSGLKDVWDFLLLKGAFHSIIPFGQSAQDTLRIEAGIPVYGVDVDENNMMLESGLADAVNFNKGCYTGQEAVAMATYRGHVSKRITGLIIKGDQVPSAGSRILKGEKEVGHITSPTYSEMVGSIISLALIKYGSFDPGTELIVETSQGALNAKAVELPFRTGSQDVG